MRNGKTDIMSLKYLTMLCYVKSLQSCPTLCDPIDGSHQAPPSLGFSRQEHWSGLPFDNQLNQLNRRTFSSGLTRFLDLRQFK